MDSNGATSDIPENLKQLVAALLVEAQVARERAQTCVRVLATVYGLPEDCVARLYAELEPPKRDGHADL